MRKIPTIYLRDPATNRRHVMNEPHPDCGWVFAGEGVPTYKWDGTAVMIDESMAVWRRREIKADKPAPDGFCQEGDPDPETGKRVGWVRAFRDEPSDRWIWEGVDNLLGTMPDSIDQSDLVGTYELVGPKVQGNPHDLDAHQLRRHGDGVFDLVPTGFDELGAWLHRYAAEAEVSVFGQPGFEGVVWHHPDGRMAKIKVRDFPEPA